MTANHCISTRKGSSSIPRRAHRALTLVELIVALSAMIVLLTAVLPAMSQARQRSMAMTCAATLANFGQLLTFYTTDNDGWLPGPNTSGVSIRVKQHSSDPEALNQSDLPVQSTDWITPLVSYEETLPANRADRFYHLLTQYRCPQQDATAALYASSPIPDLDDFFLPRVWPATSYLMSGYFQLWGSDQVRILGQTAIYLQVLSRTVDEDWEVQETDYLSRIEQVGPAANKIFVADGTQFVEDADLAWIEIEPWPVYTGSFASFGAWLSSSAAYGVAAGSLNWDGEPVAVGSASNGANLRYSYRHRCNVDLSSFGQVTQVGPDGVAQGAAGSLNAMPYPGEPAAPVTARENTRCMNAVFFDGHVENLTDRESREIELWYPSGGIVQSPEEGMTAVPTGYVIP